jgi:hypothetical protein
VLELQGVLNMPAITDLTQAIDALVRVDPQDRVEAMSFDDRQPHVGDAKVARPGMCGNCILHALGRGSCLSLLHLCRISCPGAWPLSAAAHLFLIFRC